MDGICHDPGSPVSRPGGDSRGGTMDKRAFGTWVYLASKAGWQVVEADGFTADGDRGEIVRWTSRVFGT